MGNQSKKEQDAIKELALLRQQIARLESFDSNRKRTEEKLRESEEKYKTITDAATAAIVMIDGRRKIVFWNPAAERIFGYSVDEAIGMYAVASGIYTHLGLPPNILGSKIVTDLALNGLEGLVGASFVVEPDPIKAAELLDNRIKTKRQALGLEP